MSNGCLHYNEQFIVESDKCQYTSDAIISDYTYETTIVDGSVVRPIETKLKFRTERKVPKLGVMLVGIGGNNGCTCVAGAIANKMNLTWETKEGTKKSNYWGTLMLSSTIKLGNDIRGNSIYTPINNMLPMIHPNDIVWGGWDINKANLGDAMKRAAVLDYNLQQQLYPHMKDIIPLPSIYFPDFIAANQCDRANNVLSGSKQQQMELIRQNISDFKKDNSLDKVIVLWTANTERFASIEEGMNDTATNLLNSIKKGEQEISASTIFAVASILEGCTFINGSPQNTFVPGVIDLAMQHKIFIAGDDFKSGQTKMKSVLIDFLVSAGIKPVSIVSYNHLGNNDGKNLSAPNQFRSKEISKSNVVDDMVASNRILFDDDEHPDHVVVIKYVPYVGDSKRAMDEYTNEIFMGGTNTIVMHNTCEDSLLATPLIYDLIILAELCERITIQKQPHQLLLSEITTNGVNGPTNGVHGTTNGVNGATNGVHGTLNGVNGTTNGMNGTINGNKTHHQREEEWESFHPVLSLLSYMLKAPVVPNGAPVVNALFAQRQAIINIIRACLGLPPDNYMTLEHRLESSLNDLQSACDPKRRKIV